ncbi:nucleotide pyrophosphatase [Flagellimonas taeanensis]|uniref:alkaline phosphatase family protein n=1 Tax=Flavobacteriaceae TaxID=49546 RepID=UPI000E6809ED|nr:MULTISPECIES: alkaline phosphatase family protein [Allomuricauda]MDC6383826.1 alkaline phosphatase family protein [Muricauda sp. SK9]RIV48451.1 nucleotide pyrophosphatase [Allomuricauda taeanensis]
MLKNVFFVTALVTVFLSACSRNTENSPDIQHIVIIGVDGMSPNGIQKAHTPMMDSMVQNGAATMHARSVLPSSSSPNWASMIMGADTEQHGVTSNGWEKFDHQLPPVVATKNGTFPTIFTLFHDQQPEAHVGAIYDWDGFGRLFEKEDVDFDIDGDHEDNTTQQAVNYIKEHTPKFTFVHLDHVDHAGHALGHGSPEYYKSVEKADSLITEIVNATKEAGIFEKTLFIVSADHGGIGFGHGGESLAEMEIPFILYGAGIKKGYQIEETVYQYDNAATVAYAMGLQTPQSWIGRPTKGAFIGNEKPNLTYKRKEQITQPKILPDAGYFEPAGGVFKADSVAVVMQNPNNVGEIRYTIGNAVPTMENSKVYQDTFYLKQTEIVKAGIFQGDQLLSTIAEANFRLVPETKEDPVAYAIYYGEGMDKLPNFATLKPVKEGFVAEFSHKQALTEDVQQEQGALVLESYLDIPEDGKYGFFANSDDGSKLYVDGKLVVDNDGDHGVMERGEAIELTKGKHLVRVEFFNGGGGYHLDVKYQGVHIPKQIIPANHLYREK